MQTIKPEMETQTSGGFPFLFIFIFKKQNTPPKSTSLAILKQILDLVHRISLYKVCALHFTHCHPLSHLRKTKKLLEELLKEYVIMKPFVQSRQSSR